MTLSQTKFAGMLSFKIKTNVSKNVRTLVEYRVFFNSENY